MNYFYLVATLPDLDLDNPPKDLDYAEIFQLIERNLSPDDQELLKYLKYRADNRNLLSQIGYQYHDIEAGEPEAPSVFNPETIKDFKRHRNELPEYMREFIVNYEDQFRTRPLREIEEMLMASFYQEIASVQEEFIRSYYAFDRALKSMCVTYNSHLFEMDNMESSLSEESIEKAFHKGGSVGSSIKLAYPFIESLIEALDSKEPKNISRRIDRIIWGFIEEKTSTRTFSRAHVFGLYLKLLMLKRWSVLYQKQDPRYIEELMNKAVEGSGITESLAL